METVIEPVLKPPAAPSSLQQLPCLLKGNANGEKRSCDVLRKNIAETALAALRGEQSSLFNQPFESIEGRPPAPCYMR